MIKQLILKVHPKTLILKHLIKKYKYGIVVKEYEFHKPDICEVNYILIDTVKDCRKKNNHSFEYRCVYVIKFQNMENNEDVFLPITLEYKKFKSRYYGLSKKIKNARKNGFYFLFSMK